MHIVIGCAVNEQEIPMKFSSTSDGIDRIVIGIFLGRAHITLGIDRVVVLPVGRSSNSNTTTEDGATIGHGHEGVETSEAPAPECDALCIDKRQGGEILSSCHLVLRFEITQTQVSAFLKLCTACACAATIDNDTDESFFGKHTFPLTTGIETCAPSIFHLLATRAAVLIHHHGIFLRGIEVAWLQHPTVQHGAIGEFELEEFLCSADFVEAFLRLLVVNERGEHFSAVPLTKRGHRNFGECRVHIEEVAEVGGEGRCTRTTFGGEALHLPFDIG